MKNHKILSIGVILALVFSIIAIAGSYGNIHQDTQGLFPPQNQGQGNNGNNGNGNNGNGNPPPLAPGQDTTPPTLDDTSTVITTAGSYQPGVCLIGTAGVSKANFKVSDSGSGIRVNPNQFTIFWNGAPYTNVTTSGNNGDGSVIFTVSGLPDGNGPATLSFADMGGNVATQTIDHLITDATGPCIYNISLATTANATISAKFKEPPSTTAKVNRGTVKFTIDGNIYTTMSVPPISCTSGTPMAPVDLSCSIANLNLSVGPHLIQIEAKSYVGTPYIYSSPMLVN